MLKFKTFITVVKQTKKMKKFNKTLIIATIALVAIISACSKSNTLADANSINNGTLFSESTGWKRVATFQPTNMLLTAANSMEPFDMNIVDSKAQLVFSQTNGANSRLVFKGNATIGSTVNASVAPLNTLYFIPQGYAGVAYGNVFFKPGTYYVENLVYPYTGSGGVSNIVLHNEAGMQITSQITYNFADLGFNTKMLSNGDIITGGVYSSVSLEVNYFTRATNGWNRQTPNVTDQSYNIEYTPFKIADGSLLAFRMSYKKNPLKGFLSITDFTPSTQQAITNRFVEEHPEYAPTNYIVHQYTPDEVIYASNVKIVSCAVENNSFTVVLREENNTTHNYTLSAYKWAKGDVMFQKLYGLLPISKLLADNLNRRDLIVCQPDGTVAAIVKEGLNGNQMTYSLATCNASGEHRFGAVVNNTYPRAVTILSCLRYFNESYYAVASPSLYSSDNADGQHLDVVKLIP